MDLGAGVAAPLSVSVWCADAGDLRAIKCHADPPWLVPAGSAIAAPFARTSFATVNDIRGMRWEGFVRQLMRIVTWRPNQPAMLRWLEAFALFGIALAIR